MKRYFPLILLGVVVYEVTAFVYNNYILQDVTKPMPFDFLTTAATDLGIYIPALPGQWQ